MAVANRQDPKVPPGNKNALAYFHEQFHQPEDRAAIRVRLILL
jgi:hypothetical protein